MDDILSHGGDREPSPWPRRLATIAALTAVVVGGAVYLSLPRHQHAAVATHRTSVTVRPVPVPAGPDVLSLPPEADGIAGPTLAWDRDLQLPVAGAQPGWFSPASGRSEPIGGLPADRSGYQFIRVVGGWAVQPRAALPAGCGSCAGPPVPVWLLADGAQSASRVGTASLVAPAATAGAVWLTSYAPGVNMTTGAGTAREAGDTGALTRPVRLPPGYAIDQGTDRGLLLAPVGQQPGAAVYELWDPSAPQASQTFDGVLAASPGEVAWTSQCALECSIQTLDLATGRHAVIALPAGELSGQWHVQSRRALPRAPGELRQCWRRRRAGHATRGRARDRRSADGRARDVGQQRRSRWLRLAGQRRQPCRRVQLHDQDAASILGPRC